MDTDTHPLVVNRMGEFIKRFNGVHLNKILEVQGKDVTRLPTMPGHVHTVTGKSALCYQKLAGHCRDLMPECEFSHLTVNEITQPFIESFCSKIEQGIQKIMTQGYLPASNKRGGERGGRGG